MKYLSHNETYKERFKDYLDNCSDDVDNTYRYFNKSLMMLDAYKYAKSKLLDGDTFIAGFGNYDSPVMFIFKEPNAIYRETLRLALIKANIVIEDVYITFSNKSSLASLNKTILNLELKALDPKIIVNIGTSLDIEKDIKTLTLNDEVFSDATTKGVKKSDRIKAKKRIWQVVLRIIKYMGED